MENKPYFTWDEAFERSQQLRKSTDSLMDYVLATIQNEINERTRFAQQIISMIEHVEKQTQGEGSETLAMDLTLALVDDIKKLCEEQSQKG